MSPTILNDALSLALKWGEQWLMPIQSRLHERYPELARDELDRCDALCREAMNHGHRRVAAGLQTGDEAAARERWREEMARAYPWISDENLATIFSQGMYYAWKDGYRG